MSGRENIPSFECKREETDRRVMVQEPRTVYNTLRLLFGAPVHAALAEYIQTQLANEGILESILEKDGKRGYRIPEGYIFVLDNKGKMHLEHKGMLRGKEEVTPIEYIGKDKAFHLLEYDLGDISEKYLKPKEQARTRTRLDALKNEINFERAFLEGDRERVRDILKNTPRDVKHLRFLNIIRHITEKDAVCTGGKTLSGFWVVRQIFTKPLTAGAVQIDFLGDVDMAKDILAYDLFGDMPSLWGKNQEYRLGGFTPTPEWQDAFEYLTQSGERLDLHEGDMVMMRADATSLKKEEPPKREESIPPQKSEEQKGEPKKEVKNEKIKDKKEKEQKKTEKQREDAPVPEKKERAKKASRKTPKNTPEKWGDKTLMEKKEKIFLAEFGPFLEAISATYNLPKNHFLSLIERESSFDPNRDDNPHSFGYTQLTSSPFRDMKYEYSTQERSKKTGKVEKKIVGQAGRGYLYSDFFFQAIQDNPDLLNESLIEQIPSKEGRELFQKLGDYARSGVEQKEKAPYDKAIQDLYRLAHTDHFVNILTGAIVYEWVRREGQRVKGWKISDVFGVGRTIQSDLKKMKDSTLMKFVVQGAEPTREQRKKIIAHKKQIIGELQKKNEQTYLDFYSLYRYNGDTKNEIGENLPHQLYFAMSILIKERIRNRA